MADDEQKDAEKDVSSTDDEKKEKKKDRKSITKSKSKQSLQSAADNVVKKPIAQLRVTPSILIREDISTDSLHLEKTDKKIQKYKMYLGGYPKDQARIKYNIEKEKRRQEKFAKELEEKRKLRDIDAQEAKQELQEAKIFLKQKPDEHDEKLLPVTERKKVKLLYDGTYAEFDEDNLAYYHNPRTRVYLMLVFIVAQGCGIAALTLTPIYAVVETGSIITYLQKGYRKKGKTIHFAMGALWIYIFGNGFILFRITSAYKVNVLKWFHALVYVIAMPLPLYIVNAYFNVKEENQDLNHQEHNYSLHSFLGYLTTYLYIFEICCGIVVYTVFYYRQVHRNIYYQIHSYMGLLAFFLGVITFGTGITMEEYDIKVKVSEDNGVIAALNFAGVCMCAFAVLVLFLIINPDFDVEKIVRYPEFNKLEKKRTI